MINLSRYVFIVILFYFYPALSTKINLNFYLELITKDLGKLNFQFYFYVLIFLASEREGT